MAINYIEEIKKYRKARDKRLKTSPQSWLSLVGLFKLEPGDNPFGMSMTNKIVLTQCGQMHCGSFHLENKVVSLIPQTDSSLTVNDLPPEPCALHTDQDGEPDLICIGSLTMMVLLRGNDYYLRVWDKDSPAFTTFIGLKYFPVDPGFRIEAEFEIYDPPKAIKIPDVLGIEHNSFLVGEAHFILKGINCRLVAEENSEGLLFSFTDETRKDLTYPGGRYITSEKPGSGRVTLDFNMAVNWPCAYTVYATCPLPPVENRLPVRIEAGEMRYSEH
jgi:uncharacterized protein (DUF1684 family)